MSETSPVIRKEKGIREISWGSVLKSIFTGISTTLKEGSVPSKEDSPFQRFAGFFNTEEKKRASVILDNAPNINDFFANPDKDFLEKKGVFYYHGGKFSNDKQKKYLDIYDGETYLKKEVRELILSESVVSAHLVRGGVYLPKVAEEAVPMIDVRLKDLDEDSIDELETHRSIMEGALDIADFKGKTPEEWIVTQENIRSSLREYDKIWATDLSFEFKTAWYDERAYNPAKGNSRGKTEHSDVLFTLSIKRMLDFQGEKDRIFIELKKGPRMIVIPIEQLLKNKPRQSLETLEEKLTAIYNAIAIQSSSKQKKERKSYGRRIEELATIL